MSSSSAPHVARTAYEVFLANLRREPSAAEYEQWATDHAGDPDEPRALVDAGWSIARGSGDLERALELFRRAAGFGGEVGRDAQVGIAEQLYALHRDQEADEAQRALRAELDDQPSGLGTMRVFDDMTEMLSDAGQDHLALEWCQAGVDRAVEAGDDPEVEERRHALLISRSYLREKLGVELDEGDLQARAEADSSFAEFAAMMRERPGPFLPGSDAHAARDEGAFDGIVLRWVREDFRAVRSRWPESTTAYGDDYETYAGRIQREARSYEQSGATRVRLVSGGLADYETYARAQQRDPAATSTRRDYGEWCTKARPDRYGSGHPSGMRRAGAIRDVSTRNVAEHQPATDALDGCSGWSRSAGTGTTRTQLRDIALGQDAGQAEDTSGRRCARSLPIVAVNSRRMYTCDSPISLAISACVRLP